VTAPAGRRSPWRAIAAATALNAPLGSLYAFSVLLRPLEALLGLTRADLALVSPYHPQGQVQGIPRWRLVLSRGVSWLYRSFVHRELHTFSSMVRATSAWPMASRTRA